jgi:hypothetical protein
LLVVGVAEQNTRLTLYGDAFAGKRRTLQARYLRRNVRIRGWLEFAREKAPCAVNTADFGAAATRATAWQIRPVTSIELSDPDVPGATP